MSRSSSRFISTRVLGGLLLGATLFQSSAPAIRADESAALSLVPNGGLEEGTNWPDGWVQQSGSSWEKESISGNDNRFVRLKQVKSGEFTMSYSAVPIPAGTALLDLKFRFRTSNVEHGQEGYNDARFIYHFRDSNRNELKPDPGSTSLPANSNGWEERSVRLTVPAGTAFMEIMPTLFNVKSGTLDFDDVNVVVVQDPKLVLIPPYTPEPTTYTLPPELKVVANQIQTVDGKTVILRGVNIPSLEWMPEGDHVLQSVKTAVGEWKSKVIRLPVNDEFWFGRGPRQNDGGQAYRALVDQCIRAAASRGAYIVLDLHAYQATQPKHLAFWGEVAALYKNNPAVLFDIINEPHDISWKVWHDGGTVEEKAAEGGKPAVTYESPGMQAVINFIRQKGARNLIVAGGLDWAYDLSGILKGFALEDKGGNGIVYSSHIYSWKKDWQNSVLAVAQKHPVILGEFGADDIRLPAVPANQQEDPYIWLPEILGFAQKNNLSWTAWSFHTDATPRLLANWEYQPTPFFGSFVRSALLGGRFEMTRMR